MRTVAALLIVGFVASAAGQATDAADRADALVKKALAAYSRTQSYADEYTARLKFVARDKAGEDVGEDETFTAEVAFERPNRVSQVSEQASIKCNGKQLWLYSGTYQEYAVSDAPATLDWSELNDRVNAGPPHVPLLILTQPDKSFAELFPFVNGFTAVEPERRNERAGFRLRGTFDATKTPIQVERDDIPFSVWMDEKTGLVGEVRVELKAVLEAMFGIGQQDAASLPPGVPTRVDEGYAVLTFDEVRTDAELKADRFAFKPPGDAREVAQLADDSQRPEPRVLLGKEAPAFTAPTLEGESLSLKDLRGKVIVLDFWATWCMPCIQAMPQIQKLHEQYKDQSVAVLGVNQDDQRTERNIESTLKRLELTFGHVRDKEGKIGLRYRVSGIPCTFLIGKDGTVQAVHQGFAPNLKAELAKQIDKLLQGESLVSSQDE